MKPFLFLLLLLTSLVACAQQPAYKDFDVDSPAQPRGGMAYLNAFLQANLRKPIDAEAKGIGGRVILTGIVESDGRLTDVSVMQGFRPDCDREALRVFRLFNAWKPAQKDGKAVRQQITAPVLFSPNTPFAFSHGNRTAYFDADGKALADSSERALYKQVTPLDTNGIPTGDAVVYQRKRSTWQEFARLPLTRRENPSRRFTDQPLSQSAYRLGHLNGNNLWHGTVYTFTASGALKARSYYENGRPTGPEITYHSNGVVAAKEDTQEGIRTVTTWYPNGQVKQVSERPAPDPLKPIAPERVSAFWDSTGQQQVIQGNGQAIFVASQRSYADTTRQTDFVEQGTYQNGLKQGIWTGRYADGSYYYEERYEQGICQGGKARAGQGDTLRYEIPELSPQFPGGINGLSKFLGESLHYPKEAQQASKQGKVYISFVVCTDGTLCDYEVIKGVSPALDEEALRVVKAMSGKWQPGEYRGQKVQVKYNLPISFSLY